MILKKTTLTASQEQNSVELEEADLEIVCRVLHALYFGNYHEPNEACTD